MAENLKTLHYPTGEEIHGVYIYNNDTSNLEVFGRLYTWEAATNNSTESKIQGACPDGWHLPTDQEWKTLENYLGIKEIEIDNLKWRGEKEGGSLKEASGNYWKSPNVGATNESGFSALPSGFRNSDGKYNFYSFYGLFWTSTEINTNSAWYRLLGYNLAKIGRSTENKNNAYSIRCIKD